MARGGHRTAYWPALELRTPTHVDAHEIAVARVIFRQLEAQQRAQTGTFRLT